MDYARYHSEYKLRIEVDDRVATLTLDRPEKRNAIDLALHSGPLQGRFRPLLQHVKWH